MNGRFVDLVVHPDGEHLGSIEVGEPWWPEVASVVAGARAAFGVDIVVLRLLDATAERHGGVVRYLVEDRRRIGAPGDVEDRRRMSWARPGGALGDVAWAHEATGTATSHRDSGVVEGDVQTKSWNLSSIWRLGAADGGDRRWLKVVPPFFAHEARLIRWLQDRGHPVPPVVAEDGARLVMEHVPGIDGHEATNEQRRSMLDRLVDIEASAIEHVDDLVAIDVPDWRGPNLQTGAAALLADIRGTTTEPVWTPATAFEQPVVDQLARLVDEIPSRLARARAAGVPDTLTHGDAHPGNARFGPGGAVTVLDWSDAKIGCPLLDLAVGPSTVADGLARWAEALPKADLHGAWAAVAPLAELRQAIVYHRFCLAIEPSEVIYHRHDIEGPARRAAAAMD